MTRRALGAAGAGAAGAGAAVGAAAPPPAVLARWLGSAAAVSAAPGSGPKRNLEFASSALTVNHHAHFGQPSTWLRGYPLEAIAELHVADVRNVLFVPAVEQGLADGDPDAVCGTTFVTWAVERGTRGRARHQRRSTSLPSSFMVRVRVTCRRSMGTSQRRRCRRGIAAEVACKLKCLLYNRK